MSTLHDKVSEKVRAHYPDLRSKFLRLEDRDFDGAVHTVLTLLPGAKVPFTGEFDLGPPGQALANCHNWLLGRTSTVQPITPPPPATARLSPDAIGTEVIDHIDDVLAATRNKLVKSMTTTRHGKLSKLARTRNINEVAVLLASAILGESR